MKDKDSHIDMIDKYLDETLSPEEIFEFENLLKTNLALAELFDEHKMIIKGMERHVLRTQIIKARKKYKRLRFIKLIAFSIGMIILIGTLVTIALLKKSETQESQTRKRLNVPNKEIQLKFDTGDRSFEENSSFKKQSTTTPKKQTKKSLNIQKTIEGDTIINIENTTILTSFVQSDTTIVDTLNRKEALLTPILLDNAPVQEFEIKTEKDTLITTAKGVKLHIPKHAFKNTKTQKLVRGKIRLELREYHEVSDMLKAGLTTTSRKKVLESCGMLHLIVTKNNLACDLNRNASIGLQFPKSSNHKDFQLFEGRKSNKHIDWKPISEKQEIKFNEPPLTQSNTITDLSKRDSTSSSTTNIPLVNFMQSNSLGWINCDRFINYKGEKAPIRVTIMAEEEINVNVFLVFHESKSILSAYSNGTNYVFNNIPVDKKVTIIAIGQSENPDQYYYLDRTLDGGNWNTNMRLEKMVKDILFQKLEHLDTIH